MQKEVTLLSHITSRKPYSKFDNALVENSNLTQVQAISVISWCFDSDLFHWFLNEWHEWFRHDTINLSAFWVLRL